MGDQNTGAAKVANFVPDLLEPAKIREALVGLHLGITNLIILS